MEAKSPQEAFDKVSDMECPELIQHSLGLQVKADVLRENDEAGENRRRCQEAWPKLNDRFADPKCEKAYLKIEELAAKRMDAEKAQRVAKEGYFDIKWVYYGTVHEVEANTKTEAEKKVAEMSLMELDECSWCPAMEAEFPDESYNWWFFSHILTFQNWSDLARWVPELNDWEWI